MSKHFITTAVLLWPGRGGSADAREKPNLRKVQIPLGRWKPFAATSDGNDSVNGCGEGLASFVFDAEETLWVNIH